MYDPISKTVQTVVDMLLENNAKRATKYISDKLVVAAQRKSFGNKIDKRERRIEISLKIGVPNYAEKEFIASCKKAGEPFPVKKVQLKFFPTKK